MELYFLWLSSWCNLAAIVVCVGVGVCVVCVLWVWVCVCWVCVLATLWFSMYLCSRLSKHV